jgi:hypothetical protein
VATVEVTDAAGNTTASSVSNPTLVRDIVAPTISITSDDNALKVGETATITFTLSESSSDFVVGDVTATNGALSSFTGSGTSYTATFTPTSASSATSASVTVASGSYTDAAGNAGGAGTTPVLAMDMVAPSAPTIALTTDTGSSNSDEITSNNGVTVSGLEAGATWEYTLDATAGMPTWVTGTGSSFNMTANTTYAVDKLGVRQTDAAGNVSAIGKNADEWIEDSTAPTAGAVSYTDGQGGGSADTTHFAATDVITLAFSEVLASVTGFTINDGGVTTSNTHTLGTSPTAIALNSPASTASFTLGTSPSLVATDTITLTGVDLAGNSASLTFTMA